MRLIALVTLLIGVITIPPPSTAQRTTFVLKDAPTGSTITFDSMRVVRTRDGASWVTTKTSVDLAVSVDEESDVPATIVVADGRVDVRTDGRPVRTSLVDLEGRVMQGMDPVPGPYVLRIESASSSTHVLINTAVNSVRMIGRASTSKSTTLSAAEEYTVTVYRGIFTSPAIRVNIDRSAGSKVNVVVQRPNWTDRVVGVRFSAESSTSWTFDTPLFRGKEQNTAEFSNLWSVSEAEDSYTLSSSGGFTGWACYTVGSPDASRWEGAYVEQGFNTEAITFDVVRAPIFIGNEVHFTSANTENMRYYLHQRYGGEVIRSVTDGSFVFVLE